MTEQATAAREEVIAGAASNGRAGKQPPRPSPCQVGMVFVWPETAQHLLESNWHRQRTRREWKAREYLTEMQTGKWGEGEDEDILIADLIDASGNIIDSFLIDGQHRLEALVKFGEGFWFAVKRKPFRSEAEIAIAYGHRGRGLPRTKQDGIIALGLAEEFDLSRKAINAASAALDLIIRGFKREQVRVTDDNPIINNIDVRHAALRDWREQIVMFSELTGGSDASQEMYSVAVEAVALVTLRWQCEIAAPFWRQVAEGHMLAKETAAHTLHGFIFGGMKSEYRKSAKHLRARAVASCWNAHYRGYPLQRINMTDATKKDAIKIEGTAYDGGTQYVVQHYEIDGWKTRGGLK